MSGRMKYVSPDQLQSDDTIHRIDAARDVDIAVSGVNVRVNGGSSLTFFQDLNVRGVMYPDMDEYEVIVEGRPDLVCVRIWATTEDRFEITR